MRYVTIIYLLPGNPPSLNIVLWKVFTFTTVKMGQDYYLMLNLTRSASDADIKKA